MRNNQYYELTMYFELENRVPYRSYIKFNNRPEDIEQMKYLIRAFAYQLDNIKDNNFNEFAPGDVINLGIEEEMFNKYSYYMFFTKEKPDFDEYFDKEYEYFYNKYNRKKLLIEPPEYYRFDSLLLDFKDACKKEYIN